MIHNDMVITAQGAERLKQELAFLEQERLPMLADALREASEGGDRFENTDWYYVQIEMELAKSRVETLRELLHGSQVLAAGHFSQEIEPGSTVIVQEVGEGIETFTLVGSAEADPDLGYISVNSPLGKMLLGRRVREEVVVPSPDGAITYQIIDIVPT